MNRRFDLVVFDWDGTIFDSTAAIATAIQDAARDVGCEVPPIERARHVIGLGLADALAYAVPGLQPADQPRLIEAYRHHWMRRATELVLFDGIRELIQTLHQQGRVLAIATGKSRAGLAQALAQTELATYFTATRCADQTNPKPHPAMLNELLVECAVQAERTVMIGDTTHDLQMATAARVAAIAVTYGAHPLNELEQAKPYAMAHSVAQLRAVLRDHG